MEQNNMHFPVDRDAPEHANKSNLNFYKKNKNLIDVIVLFLISISTVSTVSLSIYIIFSKFL